MPGSASAELGKLRRWEVATERGVARSAEGHHQKVQGVGMLLDHVDEVA